MSPGPVSTLAPASSSPVSTASGGFLPPQLQLCPSAPAGGRPSPLNPRLRTPGKVPTLPRALREALAASGWEEVPLPEEEPAQVGKRARATQSVLSDGKSAGALGATALVLTAGRGVAPAHQAPCCSQRVEVSPSPGGVPVYPWPQLAGDPVSLSAGDIEPGSCRGQRPRGLSLPRRGFSGHMSAFLMWSNPLIPASRSFWKMHRQALLVRM